MTDYGVTIGRDLRRHPGIIRPFGMDGFQLIPFTLESLPALTDMFLRYPELATTTGVAASAIDAYNSARRDKQQAAENVVLPFVQKRIVGFENGTFIAYALVSDNDEMVGLVSDRQIQSSFPNTHELGILIRPDLQNTKLARNTVRAMGAMAIDEYGAQRIEMATDETNYACRRLCESLGFHDEGRALRLQQGRNPPGFDDCHWYSWTSPSLLPERIPRPSFHYVSERTRSLSFEPDRFIAEYEFEVAQRPEDVDEILERARGRLTEHFAPRGEVQAAYETAVYLRAIAMGAAVRIWTLLTLDDIMKNPYEVINRMHSSRSQNSLQAGWNSEESFPPHPNASIKKLPYGSPEERFHTAIMDTFMRVRVDRLEGNPRYELLLDAASVVLHAEWQRATTAMGELKNRVPTKPAERVRGADLRQRLDSLSGSISDAITTLILVYNVVPEAIKNAYDVRPESERRQEPLTNDELQRTLLRSDDRLAGVLVKLHRTPFEQATGKGKKYEGRGPLRADELTVDVSNPYDLHIALAAPRLRPARTRIAQKCPAASPLPGTEDEQRGIIERSYADAQLFNYLTPSAHRAPHLLSTETALSRIAAQFAPLLWDDKANEYCAIGFGHSGEPAAQHSQSLHACKFARQPPKSRSDSLAHRRWERMTEIDIPRSQNEPLWGIAPSAPLDVLEQLTPDSNATPIL